MHLLRTSRVAARLRGRPAMRLLGKPHIRHTESVYAAHVLQLITAYRQIAEPALMAILDFIGTPQAPKFDDPHDVISRTFGSIRVGIERVLTDKQIARIAKDGASLIDQANRHVFGTQIRTVLNVNPMTSEPWIVPAVEAFVKENVSLISTIAPENLSDIEQMLYRDAKRKLSPEQMKERIIERFGVAESRAQLIARDQVGKFNGSLSQLRQTGLGIKEYVWRTAEDERVRPDHARLDGNTYQWSKPPITVRSGKRAGERNHPGQDIQCRCYPEPVLPRIVR
jgi:SPP1 gp7 family putative phage head morphogenesis protein